MSLSEMDCPLRVSITNEHGIFASGVFQDCVLEIFWVPYSIDLTRIPMEDVCMIVGMDWLSRFGAMIDYEDQRMKVRTPSGESWMFMERVPDWDQPFFAARA